MTRAILKQGFSINQNKSNDTGSLSHSLVQNENNSPCFANVNRDDIYTFNKPDRDLKDLKGNKENKDILSS